MISRTPLYLYIDESSMTTYTLSGVEQVWYFMGGAEKRHKKVSGERLPVDPHAFVILTHVKMVIPHLIRPKIVNIPQTHQQTSVIY